MKNEKYFFTIFNDTDKISYGNVYFELFDDCKFTVETFVSLKNNTFVFNRIIKGFICQFGTIRDNQDGKDENTTPNIVCWFGIFLVHLNNHCF